MARASMHTASREFHDILPLRVRRAIKRLKISQSEKDLVYELAAGMMHSSRVISMSEFAISDGKQNKTLVCRSHLRIFTAKGLGFYRLGVKLRNRIPCGCCTLVKELLKGDLG